MSENSLVAKIKSDAEEMAAEITAANEVTLSTIAADTTAKLDAMRRAHEAALVKQREQLELVAVSRAKQEAKIALQQAKRDQIDVLFAEVKQDFTELPADEYVAFFAAAAKRIMPGGVSADSVVAPAHRMVENERLAKELGLMGIVVPDDNLTAGFIIYTPDGVYDVTLDRLMREERAELEMEVVQQVNG